MFCTRNRQTRVGSRTSTSSMMELFVTKQYQEVITLLQNSSNLDDVGVLDMLLFSFHDKRGQKRRGFHMLVPYFFSRCEQYNLLLPLLKLLFFDRSISKKVSKKFYLNQSPYFGNILITCKDLESPEIFLFRNIKSFQPPVMIKKNCVSNH